MTSSFKPQLQGRDLLRAAAIALLSAFIARVPVMGTPFEKSTASLLVFSSLGVPLICAILFWNAPPARLWAQWSVRSRYGGNRRVEAARAQTQRLISAVMLALFFSWCLLLTVYEQRDALLFDAQTSAPLMLALVFSQSGICSACATWTGKLGLGFFTFLSVLIGSAPQHLGTVLPLDLAKMLLGPAQTLHESVSTVHALLALMVLGSLGYFLSLFRVAP